MQQGERERENWRGKYQVIQSNLRVVITVKSEVGEALNPNLALRGNIIEVWLCRLGFIYRANIILTLDTLNRGQTLDSVSNLEM